MTDDIDALIARLDQLCAKPHEPVFDTYGWLDEILRLNEKIQAAYPRLRAALVEARERVADWECDFVQVIADEFVGDEEHCSCVPHLRRRIAELEQERDAAREEAERLREALSEVSQTVSDVLGVCNAALSPAAQDKIE